jgi:hypothetical protein
MSRLAMLTGLFLLLSIVGVKPGRAQVRHEVKGKKVQHTTAADWLRHPQKGKYYSESWTLAARSKKGHIMYLQFLYSNIGVFTGTVAVNLSFRHPGKNAQHYVFEYSQKEWGEDQKTGRIGVGPNWMAFDGKVAEVRIKEEQVKMRVRLKSRIKGVKLHDGKYFLGKEDSSPWVQVFNHIPRGIISGEVEVEGEKFVFTGDGYVDHWVQTVLGTDYCHRMWTVRFFHKNYTIAILLQVPQKKVGGERLVQVLVADSNKVISFGESFTLKGIAEASDPKGHKYDTAYKITYGDKAGKVRLAGLFKKGKLWDRDAILDQLNKAQKQVVKWIAGNPVVYRLEGQAELTLQLGDKNVKLTGPALMESIVLAEE